MWRTFCILFKKDCWMMVSGKFFLVAFGSLILYTLFINLGYVQYMNAGLYNVYLYDPHGTQQEVSGLIQIVASSEELNAVLSSDTNGVGIDASSGTPNVVFYFGSEKSDNHRADYALSLLHQGREHTAQVVGTNTLELKQRKEMCSELLFIEIIAVGFLGIASVIFKEKQMGVIRVHAVLPFKKGLFIAAKLTVFLLSDLIFAVLMTVLN
ncbi:MAG: ABC transporter permease, partial [Lachnospiraceae bacterium]|nr:ABC transporter permease [Lachnospiraceae bacterium]